MLNRRSFLGGIIAAPAVVAAGSLMPIRGPVLPFTATEITLRQLTQREMIERLIKPAMVQLAAQIDRDIMSTYFASYEAQNLLPLA